MKKYPVYSIQNFDCNSVHSDLYVNTFKNHLLSHSFIEKPHRHDFYVLVFFTSGTGTHVVDFDHFIIQSGSVFVLQPGQMHHWCLTENTDGYIVFFSKEIYNLYFGQKGIDDYPFYSKVNSSPEIVLDKEDLKVIIPFFDALIAESNQNQLLQRDKIMNLLDIIHIELARKYASAFKNEVHSYNRKLTLFAILLEQKYKTEKAPFYYAEQLHISLKHLNRITKEVLNKTTTQVITDRVILEAKRMLMEKQFSVNEIAITLGYDDCSYFSRLFKKNTGMTATEFRTQKV
ncbi:helix-turn-helix transcriptional regulator [Flavobacterium sp. UMI-01]|uniref:AraC family transcriptional regulator n=1 Tax=Flavobacterium sp. UMI-01 TaxID=1441053 RepID=UPI001C7DFB66|nr:helix-turn-helix transcriptional regulator [Flavobacterium sp. UMI-01]GIZ08988.1 AraC family transcriptional regulator [Flavobacterium sp. UMI-01]